ncbi:MAG TPA: dihydrodipicolinate synthase family protein [Gemmatimonadales bacterium]
MSGHRQLGGILGPVVTTFRGDESLELDAFAANVRALLAAGLDGVVVTGSTGEAALVDDEERVRLLALARQLVPADRWLVAGTGAESARQAVRRCRAAAAEGADLALVVAPHYYSGAMSADALRAHYLRVADGSPIPIALYNIPRYMHFHIPPALVAELATHGNVAGIKDSSGDAALLAGYLEASSGDFAVLTGSAPGLLAALRAGARGGILAAALFAPTLALEVRDALQAGDEGAATAAQERFALIGREIVGALGVPGVKAALDLVGLSGGQPRLPLLPLDGAGRARVRDLLAAAAVEPLAAPAG